MATAEEINEIIKLYVGYYNRAPDPAGLNFWISAFDGGFGLAEMAVDFSTQAETLKNYPFFLNPSPTVEEYGLFVDAVYGNLFNRPPDGPGREFWSTKIASGEFSVGEAISLIIAGATTSPDQDVVANKVAVGRDFYIKANALPPYTFDEDDIQTATDIQASVTDDAASVTAAAALTDTYIAGLSAVTINLTDNTDQPGGGGNGVDTQGSSSDDTYSGTIEANGGGTLQSSDNLAAAGGNDTLEVRVISVSTGGQIVSPVATDLENIVVTNQSSGSIFILDATNITGEMTVTARDNDASALTGFANVEEGTMARMENVDGILGMHYKGDRSTSTDDAFGLFIQDSGTFDTSAVFITSDADMNNTDESFEIANIETGGSTGSFLNLAGLALEQLVVTGSQQLNVEDTNDSFTTLQSVDASGMTGGGVNVNADGSTQTDFSFTGSGFDDEILLNNTLFNNANTMSLDGGGGMDILLVDGFTNLDASSVNAASNFEALESNGSSSSLEADEFNDIHTFIFSGQSSNGSRTNVRGVTDEDRFIFENDIGRGDETLRFDADSAGQSLTFELAAQSGSGGEVRIFSDTSTGNDVGAIGFANNNISSVEIVSSGSNEEANVIRAIDNGSDLYFGFANSGGPNNFSISGSQALTITAEEGVSLTASSDERGFEDGVNLDGSDASGDLRIAGSGSSDTIQTGSGNDILYGLGGDNSLTGNGGSDQFRFSDWNSTDTIEDFVAGEDKVGLQRVDFANTTASTEGTALDSNDYVQNLQAVANLTNADSDKLVELQLAATNDQITQTTVASTNTYLLVFNETSGQGELWFDNDWSSTSSRSMVAEFATITELSELVGLTNTDFVEYTF